MKWEQFPEEIWSFYQRSMEYKGQKEKWKNHSLGRTDNKNHTEPHSLSSSYDAPLHRTAHIGWINMWHRRWSGSPGTGLWHLPHSLLYVFFSPGLRYLPPTTLTTPVPAMVALQFVNANWWLPPEESWPTYCNRSWISPWEVPVGSTHWEKSRTPQWIGHLLGSEFPGVLLHSRQW